MTLPSIERAGALAADLAAERGLHVDQESAVPNPLQGLWLLRQVEDPLPGDGLIASDGDHAWWTGSTPDEPEFEGAEWPEDDEDYLDDDEEYVQPPPVATRDVGEGDDPFGALRAWLAGEDVSTFATAETERQIQDERWVTVMAVPAEGDPCHGVGPEDKHATVLYLGSVGAGASHNPALDDDAVGLVHRAVEAVAAAFPPFIEGVKVVDSLGDGGAQVWLLDGDHLPAVRDALVGYDPGVPPVVGGVEQYPEYTPHVTIGYDYDPVDGLPEPDEQGVVRPPLGPEVYEQAERVGGIRFDRLSVWDGGTKTDYPLAGNDDEAEAVLAAWDDGDEAEFEALVARFAGQGRWKKKNPDGPGASTPRLEEDGVGSGPTKGWDEKAHPRGTGAKGGQFIPKDSAEAKKGRSSKGGASVDEDKPASKQERVKALVEGVLDALKDVMKDLTGPQAQALMKRIKANAEAFIDGQAAAPHKGGGSKSGGSSGVKDGTGSKAPAKKAASPKDGTGSKGSGGSSSGGSGTSGGPSGGQGVAGIVAGLKSLLDQFGDKMKKGDREKLEKAAKALGDA